MYKKKLLRRITDLRVLQVRTKDLHIIDHGRWRGVCSGEFKADE